jgi:ABC-type sulfate/molybdate transport systems ATPase subunit
LEHAANSNIVVAASDDPEVVAKFSRVVELNQGRVERIADAPVR